MSATFDKDEKAAALEIQAADARLNALMLNLQSSVILGQTDLTEQYREQALAMFEYKIDKVILTYEMIKDKFK